MIKAIQWLARTQLLPPPGVRDDNGFVIALLAQGPRTTPPRLVVVVKETLIFPDNRYAGGLYFSSEEEDDSPPLLDLPAGLEASTATALMSNMAAALTPNNVEAVMASVTEKPQPCL